MPNKLQRRFHPCATNHSTKMKTIYSIASEKEIALIKSAGISDSDLSRPHLSVNEMDGETEIVLSSGTRVTIYDAVEPLIELPGTWEK
jgi:hypothetical protein